MQIKIVEDANEELEKRMLKILEQIQVRAGEEPHDFLVGYQKSMTNWEKCINVFQIMVKLKILKRWLWNTGITSKK